MMPDVWREPLVHFVVLGAAVLALIVVTFVHLVVGQISTNSTFTSRFMAGYVWLLGWLAGL